MQYMYDAFPQQCSLPCLYKLAPEQNGRHFADDIFKCSLLNENVCILIQISLMFALKSLVNDVSTGSGNDLVPDRRQAITWTSGVTCSTMPYGITRPQWVKQNLLVKYPLWCILELSWPCGIIDHFHHLVKVMACCLIGTKLLYALIRTYTNKIWND